jgi:putative ABC transport system permease protein
MVSEGFVEAMGLRLLAGRTFDAGDREGAEPVMMISEQLARQQFADRNPVGERFYSRSGNRRIVGVVGDVRPAAPAASPKPAAYLPLRQNPDVLQWFATMNVVVRGPDPRGLGQAVRPLVLSLDAEMPPFNVRGLDDEVSRLLAGPRFSAVLLTVFALVALAMASIGVYGVMAHSVAQRTHELGVRMALGAGRADVMGLVLRQSAALAAAGILAGLSAAAALTRYLEGMLFGLTAFDPGTLLAVSLTLALAVTLAAYVPARRATRVDPLIALRGE